MPKTEFSDRLHGMKHRGTGEDHREAMHRVSFGLKDDDNHYHALRSILLQMRYLFGGRIQTAIGSLREVTAYNCFVSGSIADSFVDGPGSIMARAHEAAATMRMGGGIGYDFSTLRPTGALIKRLQSHSSGPISFMRIFNEICLCTASSGHRRGAQMGIMRVDHPDIETFIRAKQNTEDFRGFNLSIALTNAFMEAALTEKPFDLRFNGEVYSTIDAAALWEMIMRSTWDWGEPGAIFIDTINEMNNLHYCEEIAATNPCGEQPLPPYGACLLGSFNLPQYLVPTTPHDVDRPSYRMDFDQLRADIPPIVRAMDNVVDRARYPLPQHKAEAVTKRRMGIGVTGLANALEACGHPYGTEDFLVAEQEVLGIIRDEAYRASARLAAEKGAFPLYDEEKYLQGQFIKTLPDDIKDLIRRHGIRNSHLTSIAPAGTISMAADCVSSGLEPVYEYATDREINTPDGKYAARTEDYGVKFLGVKGVRAHEVTAQQHVAVQAAAQSMIDSAVSKTVNMDSKTMNWHDFKALYQTAWESGCKGCATFNASGKRMGLLQAAAEDSNLSCQIDTETGRMECA